MRLCNTYTSSPSDSNQPSRWPAHQTQVTVNSKVVESRCIYLRIEEESGQIVVLCPRVAAEVNEVAEVGVAAGTLHIGEALGVGAGGTRVKQGEAEGADGRQNSHRAGLYHLHGGEN